MLVKLTPGVNLTYILQDAFLYKSVLLSCYAQTVCVCNLCRKKICEKAANKMLLKLATGCHRLLPHHPARHVHDVPGTKYFKFHQQLHLKTK